MAYEKKDDELGSLWVKQSNRGPYLSGEIDGIGPVVCFPVKSDNPKAPAWRVMRSKPRERVSSAASAEAMGGAPSDWD